jgi:hypothetical protein
VFNVGISSGLRLVTKLPWVTALDQSIPGLAFRKFVLMAPTQSGARMQSPPQ